MKRLFYPLLIIGLLFSCKEDDDDASIVGNWQGDRLEVKASYGIITLYEDSDEDFAATLSFKDDGTVVYTKDNVESSGTYTIAGDQLTTNVEFDIYELAGPLTFDIAELSDSKLQLKLKETRPVTVPDLGEVPVTVTATLDFVRL